MRLAGTIEPHLRAIAVTVGVKDTVCSCSRAHHSTLLHAKGATVWNASNSGPPVLGSIKGRDGKLVATSAVFDGRELGAFDDVDQAIAAIVTAAQNPRSARPEKR